LDERVHPGAIDAVGRVVTADAVLVPVEAGQQGGQAGATEGGGDVAVREGSALLGQAVDVRGLYHLVAHEAEVGPALVVADDEDDVGRSSWGDRRRRGRGG